MGRRIRKWNWYGGLAYEYEFDGKSDGTVSAGGVSAAIRAASIKGSSVRGEIGMKMNATKTNRGRWTSACTDTAASIAASAVT